MNFKIKNVLPLLYQSPCGHYIFVYQILDIHFIVRFRLIRVFSHKSFI